MDLFAKAKSTPPQEFVLPIRYDNGRGQPKNTGMQGEGRLRIRADGQTYVFEGSVRSMFSTRQRSLEFKATDIWNVGGIGSRVQFMPSRGGSRNAAPFIFYCDTDAQAAAVVHLLPRNAEPDFADSIEFSRKLWSGPAAGGGGARLSVTNVIIALNVLVFVTLAAFFGAGWLQTASMRPYILYGANNGGATTDGEWWRLVTSLFMHFGLLHIAFNMWAYFQAGHLAERLFGRRLYLLGYFSAGIAGSFASIFWNGDKVWSAGASGAIFGVYGLILGYLLREKHRFPQGVFKPMIRSTATFAVYNLAFGSIVQGIDNSAHVGGFAMGIALGWLMARPLDGDVRQRLFIPRLVTGAALTVAMIAAGVLLSPRFHYHFREELAWQDAIIPFAKRESAITPRLNSSLAALRVGRVTTDDAQWVNEKAIPFYSDWRKSIDALHLTPGLDTEQRREEADKEINNNLALCRKILEAAARDRSFRPDET